MSATTLFLGLMFGGAGFVFFRYGRRQSAVVPMLCGIGLMLVPYVTSDPLLLTALGAALALIPYFVRI